MLGFNQAGFDVVTAVVPQSGGALLFKFTFSNKQFCHFG